MLLNSRTSGAQPRVAHGPPTRPKGFGRSLQSFSFVFASLLSASAVAQPSPSSVSQTVELPSGSLRLKALLWTPDGAGPFPVVLFNHGSGEADAAHTAGRTMVEAANTLGPLFVRHGYAFLYLFRRGQGLSADQGTFMQDLLQREEVAKGTGTRQHLQFVLLTTDHLDDVLAALSYLRSVPRIDSRRIAVAGHSFGGQLTLLAAEHEASVRAAVTFAAASSSWARSLELRERLLLAVRRTNAPIMLIHAENDFSTAAGRALAEALARLKKQHTLKIYPAVGKTQEDGHNAVYNAIPQWEDDVFGFLDEHVKR